MGFQVNQQMGVMLKGSIVLPEEEELKLFPIDGVGGIFVLFGQSHTYVLDLIQGQAFLSQPLEDSSCVTAVGASEVEVFFTKGIFRRLKEGILFVDRLEFVF